MSRAAPRGAGTTSSPTGTSLRDTRYHATAHTGIAAFAFQSNEWAVVGSPGPPVNGPGVFDRSDRTAEDWFAKPMAPGAPAR